MAKVCSSHYLRLEGIRAASQMGFAVSLFHWKPQILPVWGWCCGSLSTDLIMLEHLGVQLPLIVVGLDAELVFNECSGHRLRMEVVMLFSSADIYVYF